jgi:hypothetical protein
MEITHKSALGAAILLKMYCKERFNKELGERGCKECIFSAGERFKRCVLHHFIDGIYDTVEQDIDKNYKRLQNGN